jgi:uncharacterized protein (TIGR03083 family)
MALAPLPRIDTRRLFRPLARNLGTTLEGLPAAAWDRPTVAGSWLVRDVVAHLSDTALRRLSHHRDGQSLPPPPGPAGQPPDERAIADLVNGLNRSWVTVARRFSPRVLTALYRTATDGLADFFEGLSLDGPAPFGVSWAGEDESPVWFDVAREFTEQWHHGAQVREAVGAPPFPEPAWLSAVIGTAVRALPHAYRGVEAAPGTSVVLEVLGPAGGVWTLRRETDGWSLWGGAEGAAAARARTSDDSAWRLFFHALSPKAAGAAVRVDGDEALVAPLLAARSVVV